MGYDYSYDKPYKEESAQEKKLVQAPGSQATASGHLKLSEAGFQAFISGTQGGPGEAWTIARMAGIMGAKQADELILVSHSCNIRGIDMNYSTNANEKTVIVTCEVKTAERLGAETAALVGCGVALMALVDSLRAIDRNLSVEDLRIVRE